MNKAKQASNRTAERVKSGKTKQEKEAFDYIIYSFALYLVDSIQFFWAESTFFDQFTCGRDDVDDDDCGNNNYIDNDDDAVNCLNNSEWQQNDMTRF